MCWVKNVALKKDKNFSEIELDQGDLVEKLYV